MSYKAKGLIPVTVPLSPAEYARIRAMADSDDRSIAKIAREILAKAGEDRKAPKR
jgi:hypothetical protein